MTQRRLHCWSLPCLVAADVLPHRRQASPALCLAIACCFCHCSSVRVFLGARLGPEGLSLRVIPAGLGPCKPAFLTCRYILTKCCCHSATPRIPHSLRTQAPGSSVCFWRPSVALRSACLLRSQCFGSIPRSLAYSWVRWALTQVTFSSLALSPQMMFHRSVCLPFGCTPLAIRWRVLATYLLSVRM